MTYLKQADLAQDPFILRRVAACAATQHINEPMEWAASQMWRLSAEPGWVPAYMSAIAGGDGQPGENEAAITDGMILAAVQTLLNPEV